MFESLSDRLTRAIKVLKGQGKITEINITETVKEIRRALLEADVNYKVAKEITGNIKEQAIGQKVMISVTPGQLFTRIVADELAKIMGGMKSDIIFSSHPPTVILLSGLQGSGKTTFAAKLAHLLHKRGRSPLLVACDVYRPAAIEQLKVLSQQVPAEMYTEENSTDPVSIAYRSLDHARKNAKDTVIIDTAGRLAVDDEMMNEISAIRDKVKPSEVLFVVDAMTGQDAVNTSRAFNDRLGLTGVVLTKLDGDARGGAALSIKAEINQPVKFVSTGENIDAVDNFHPDRMAQRILGMGDILTLVEKAQEQFDRKEAEKIQEKLKKNTFDFNDFLGQVRQMKKMGSVKDIVSMIPGVGSKLENIDVDDKQIARIEAIILSMTQKERQKPEIIDGSRRRRIAAGSGTSISEVNQLLKQFSELRKMMRTASKFGMAGRAMQNLMSNIQLRK